MKTISLNDKAYERLASWKRSPRDSFSKVVVRVVPSCGSLKSVGKAAQLLPALTDEQSAKLSDAMQELKRWTQGRDPWTT